MFYSSYTSAICQRKNIALWFYPSTVTFEVAEHVHSHYHLCNMSDKQSFPYQAFLKLTRTKQMQLVIKLRNHKALNLVGKKA